MRWWRGKVRWWREEGEVVEGGDGGGKVRWWRGDGGRVHVLVCMVCMMYSSKHVNDVYLHIM